MLKFYILLQKLFWTWSINVVTSEPPISAAVMKIAPAFDIQESEVFLFSCDQL